MTSTYLELQNKPYSPSLGRLQRAATSHFQAVIQSSNTIISGKFYVEIPLFKGARNKARLIISLNRKVMMLWQGCVI